MGPSLGDGPHLRGPVSIHDDARKYGLRILGVQGMVPPDVPLTYLDFTNPANDVQAPLFRYADNPDVLADNIISDFKAVFGADSIGARSDSLLRNAIYAGG